MQISSVFRSGARVPGLTPDFTTDRRATNNEAQNVGKHIKKRFINQDEKLKYTKNAYNNNNNINNNNSMLKEKFKNNPAKK